MTLLGQPMEQVSSAAMCLAVPAGSATDPPEIAGAASVICEWLFRGAGDRDTRQLNDALDSLGCQHGEDVQSRHVVFSAAQLGRNLPDVLEIYADVVRRGRLEDDAFEPGRTLVLQDIVALEDEPARKCNLLLRERFYPAPLGRCLYGTPQTLEAMTPKAVRDHATRQLTPDGAILSVAGKIDWDRFCDQVEELFGDWQTDPPPAPAVTPPAGGITYVRKDSAQAHIALAHPAAILSHPRYYAARMSATVLSGGMSSRLFTEVREKRGLAYHVATHYHCLRDHAGMFTYVGTGPENAQETFEVTVGELRRLADGVEDDEIARARVQLKSALVMQGESTSARAHALAVDWYHLGRLRGLREISDAIDAVGADDVLAYLADFPSENFTMLVIAPKPVDAGILHNG